MDKATILVVDDDPSVIQLLRDDFNSENWEGYRLDIRKTQT